MIYSHSTSTITKPLKMSYILFSAQKKISSYFISNIYDIFYYLSQNTELRREKTDYARESFCWKERKEKKINAMWLPHRTETFFQSHPSLAVSPKVSNNTCLSQHPLIAHVFATLWFFGSPTQRWTVTWFLLLLTLPFLLPVFWK